MAFRIMRRLSELLDVLIATPADGEVLTYSSAAGKWENQAGGGGSQPFTEVISVDPVPDNLTGRTFTALSTLEPQVVWAYDGAQVLSVAITGYLPNTHLTLSADDDLSSAATGYTDINGDVTLDITNVGFNLGNGPTFHVHIHTPTGLFGDEQTIRTLSEGTPYGATESYRPGIFAVYVLAGGSNPNGNETVTRGIASFYPDGQSVIPVRVIAASGQADKLFVVYEADGATELFAIGNDGTPAFHGAGVPQIPAVPTAQDVTDALITLGLVTQA